MTREKTFQGNVYYCRQKTKEKQLELGREQWRAILDNTYLNEIHSMPYFYSHTRKRWANNQYSIFAVKALHLYHLRISKKLKAFIVPYISSSRKKIISDESTKSSRRNNSHEFQRLNASNNLKAVYRNILQFQGFYWTFCFLRKLDRYMNFSHLRVWKVLCKTLTTSQLICSFALFLLFLTEQPAARLTRNWR